MEKAVLPQHDKTKQAATEKAIIDLRKMVENRFAIGGVARWWWYSLKVSRANLVCRLTCHAAMGLHRLIVPIFL